MRSTRVLIAAGACLALALVITGWSGTRSANAGGFVAISNLSPAVFAGWEFQNGDGSSTFVSVFAGKEKIGHAGPGPVFVDISQVWPAGDPEDPSDDVIHSISAYLDLEPGQLEVSLDDPVSAHLAFTAQASDCTYVPASGLEPVCSSEPVEVSVDLDWAASSDRERARFSDHGELSPGCRINDHTMFKGFPADVSGSITANGVDHTRGEPVAYGEVFEKYLSQSVLIAHTLEDCFSGIPAAAKG